MNETGPRMSSPELCRARGTFAALLLILPTILPDRAAGEEIVLSESFRKCSAAAGEDWEKKFDCAAVETMEWNTRSATAIRRLSPLNSTRPAFMERLKTDTETFNRELPRSCVDPYLPIAEELGHHRTHYLTGLCSLFRYAARTRELERLGDAFYDAGLLPSIGKK